jgi:hypothetical protein
MPTGDVPDDEMNENLFPFKRHEHPVSADDAEKLLRGVSPAAASTPEVLAVADVLAALCLPARSAELAGEKAAVAAFAAVKEKALAPDQPRRRSMLSAFTGAKLAVAAVAGSLALGGVAAAAVTGSLPGPFQDIAHTLGAPGAGSDEDDGIDPTESGSPDDSSSGSASASSSSSSHSGTPAGTQNGPSTFAVCWYIVHKTDGAAGGPWVDRTSPAPSVAPTGTALPQPSASGSDPSDQWDHGQGEWSNAYARLKATAGASGQTVLDYCTAWLVQNAPNTHPSKPAKNGDKHGKGHSRHGADGRGQNSHGHGGQGSDGGSPGSGGESH